ncbi:bestrophin family protein [Runella salmonicolor]|uniref:Hydrogenase n=1 Tax=Runella salmonicolor TaxID=2950278 RepID=A0ABT1FUB4_9BACT|nr:bestrophin family ion channel [Runella salmonicolor]MCP1385324.1 hydrogenase [Runella salmonicolor]
MILRKNFDLRIVFWNIRYETSITLFVSIIIWLLHKYGAIEVVLPFSVAAILGSALAIFIAFRNQSAYARWWEGRTIWGGIINNSRIFARQVIANADNATALGKISQEAAQAYKKEMVHRQIAFAHALRLHLRRQTQWSELQHLLSPAEFESFLKAQNKPNILLNTQGIRLREGMRTGALDIVDNFTMEPNLATFNNWQGACERIKNTPLPRNYHYFTRLFLYTFIFVLPICLVSDLKKMEVDYMVAPVSFILCFVFSVMNRVGEINEAPFENGIQDIPMTALCNTIERDLKEQLGETDLPVKLEPVKGFLF